jgi:LysR family nitrogen assimilation transcriptional regulator
VDLWAGRHGVEIKVQSECDSWSATRQLVAGGVGCTILPEAAIRAELDRGELVCAPIVEPVLRRSMVLATPTNRPMAAGLGDVARIIKCVSREICGGPEPMPMVTPVRRVPGRLPAEHAVL